MFRRLVKGQYTARPLQTRGSSENIQFVPWVVFEPAVQMHVLGCRVPYSLLTKIILPLPLNIMCSPLRFFWGCEMVNGVEADLDVVVVIVYRLAHVFLTCGVEWNTRGATRLAFLRNELAGIRWMMYRGGSELWLRSFSMATCRLGWILWFPSFKLEASNHKYNHHSIFDISGVNFGEHKSTRFRPTLPYFCSNIWLCRQSLRKGRS